MLWICRHPRQVQCWTCNLGCVCSTVAHLSVRTRQLKCERMGRRTDPKLSLVTRGPSCRPVRLRRLSQHNCEIRVAMLSVCYSCRAVHMGYTPTNHTPTACQQLGGRPHRSRLMHGELSKSHRQAARLPGAQPTAQALPMDASCVCCDQDCLLTIVD